MATPSRENNMDARINFISESAFLLGFLLVYISIVIWVLRPAVKQRYQPAANLPAYGDKKK